MRVHLCGVRGSTPSPGPDFSGVGGHTSCVALAHDGAHQPSLVLDAGTGLRRLTQVLGGAPFRGTILLGHLHWDHTQGLPFFVAGDRPDASVRVLLPAQDGEPEEILERWMSPPFFPIAPGGLRGDWTFGLMDEGCRCLEGFTVLAREIPHKGGRTFGFRISDGHSVLAYLSDHGPTALGPGTDGLGALHPAALELATAADLLIHDAQHTATEFAECAPRGHSSVDYAVGLATRAGARRLLLFHHDPDRTDGEVAEIVARARRFAPVQVDAAVEGAVLHLGDHDR